MPYQEVSMKNGATERMRAPCWPRKTIASQTSPTNPEHLRPRLRILQVFPGDSPAESGREMEQNAAIAERYIKTHHQFPDHPRAAGSGVSCTIRMPIARSDNVRMAT